MRGEEVEAEGQGKRGEGVDLRGLAFWERRGRKGENGKKERGGEIHLEVTQVRQRPRQADNLLGGEQRRLLEVGDGAAVLVRLAGNRLDDPAEVEHRRLSHHVGEE